VLNREDARTSTGHGSPGRSLFMVGLDVQAVGKSLGYALGASPTCNGRLSRALRTCGLPSLASGTPGADQHFGEHPFRSLATLRIGDAVTSELRQVTLADITAFANSTGDTFYAHTNEEARLLTRSSPGIVATVTCCCPGPGTVRLPEPGPCWPTTGWKRPGSSSLWPGIPSGHV